MNRYPFYFLFALMITALATVCVSCATSEENLAPRKTYLTFVFDDGYEDCYTTAFPILQKYNVRATVNVIVQKIGDFYRGQKLMTWDQIRELQENGWEIGSHTSTHPNLTKLGEAAIEKELTSSKAILESEGFAVKILAIPYGRYNDQIKGIAKKHYEAVRPSIWGANLLRYLDRYSIKSFWITNTATVEDVKTWINKARKNRDWVVLVVHMVREDTGLEYAVSPGNFEKVVQYVKRQPFEIRTMSEVLDLVKD